MSGIPVPIPRPRSGRPPPVLNSDSTDPEEQASGSPFFQSKPIQVVHTVEVHNSVGDTSTNAEDNSSKGSERKKKKLKRKGTFSISRSSASLKSQDTVKPARSLEVQSLNGSPKKIHSGTETVSESSSSPGSNKVKLIVGDKRRKKPSGYATETLSEESEPEGTPDKKNVEAPEETETMNNDVLRKDGKESPPRLKEKLLEKLKDSSDVKSVKSLGAVLPPPVPKPRISMNRSLENLLLSESHGSVLDSPKSYCTSSSLDYKDTGSLPKPRIKKPRKKKKLKEHSATSIENEEMKSNSKSSPKETKAVPESTLKKLTESEEKFICLTIHNCEPLKIKDFKTRPFVKVTLMEGEGKLKSSTKGDSVEPLSTQPFDFTCNRSPMPIWNEDLIVMEPLSTILKPNTLLIFEVLDDVKGKGIAWGFLKPVGANGASNAGKKLRLQLFKQGKPVKDSPLPPAFYWWKKCERKKYKSTLFVTLSGIPRKMIVQNNPGEQPKKSEDQIKPPSVGPSGQVSENEDQDLEDVKWSRLPSLSCKLPNKYLARLPAGPDGSLALAYSHSGLLLASANKVNIGIFTFRGRPYLSLQGHSGLVYCLRWSPNDKYLLSASADFTSHIWDIGKKVTSPIQRVCHPSYVYSCAWLDNSLLVTGCFDCDIRLWRVGYDEALEQVSKHRGHINSLVAFDNYLVSGDSSGVILIWKWTSQGTLEFERELLVREIKGKIINKLSLHPGKKRLLVHTRDSILRMIDLATGAVLLWFQGLVNNKLREDSTLCGCGSLVLAWSEDSTLCAWDSNTSAQLALYPTLIPDSRPGAVDFHPRDHMMAVSAFSSATPILCLLVYDRKSNGREVGLVPLTKNIKNGLGSTDQLSPYYSDRSSESTPKKKESLLKTLLTSKKKIKTDSSAQQSTEDLTKESTKRTKYKKIPLDDNLDTAEKEGRLTEIIKKMDKILTTVSNNNRSLYTS